MANVRVRSGIDTDSIRVVDAVEQLDEVLQKLFQTPASPSEIQEHSSRESR